MQISSAKMTSLLRTRQGFGCSLVQSGLHKQTPNRERQQKGARFPKERAEWFLRPRALCGLNEV
jgi:hypothetical protein